MMTDLRNNVTQELYVWHERQNDRTTSRFYFKETMTRRIFISKILPTITSIVGIASNNAVRGYPHQVTVEWIHEINASENEIREYEKMLDEYVDLTLNDAFNWFASVRKTLKNFNEVQQTSTGLNVNWRRGQFPL